MVAGAEQGVGRGEGSPAAADVRGSKAGRELGCSAIAPPGAKAARPPPDPRKMVRTNQGMAAGELDKYVRRTATPADAGPSGARDNAGAVLAAGPHFRKRAREDGHAPLVVHPSTCGGKRAAVGAQEREWASCELSSIHGLLRKVAQVHPRVPRRVLRRVSSHRPCGAQRSNAGLKALFANSVFVGAIDGQYMLLQHLTKLHVVHIGVVSEEFLYQQARISLDRASVDTIYV